MRASESEALDYERMVQAYYENLATVLRGFKGTELFEFWVPDDDHVKSIVNLLEAAQSVGRPEVVVRLGAAVATTFDVGALLAQTRAIAEVTITPDTDGGLLLDARKLVDRSLETVQEAYRDGLADAAARALPVGSVADRGGVRLTATDGDVAVTAWVDGATHEIVDASFEGATTTASLGLLKTLCAVLAGLTVQEASDHALIAVENALRDDTCGRPVQGIVSPEHAGPVFAAGQRLVRSLLTAYRATTGYSATSNEFHHGPSAEWAALPDQERTHRLRQQLPAICDATQVPLALVEQMSVVSPDRAVVEFAGGIPSGQRRDYLHALERELRRRFDDSIRVHAAELKDKNAIRRL